MVTSGTAPKRALHETPPALHDCVVQTTELLNSAACVGVLIPISGPTVAPVMDNMASDVGPQVPYDESTFDVTVTTPLWP